MNSLNYMFFEEFKRLDKLCGELYDTQYGVTHYIDDMKSAAWDDCKHISNWKPDLKELIRLRHIRNHLAHTEGAFQEAVCTKEDVDWIKKFYRRIMNQSDPLAMLYRSIQTKNRMSEQAYYSSLADRQEYGYPSFQPSQNRLHSNLTDRQAESQKNEELGTVPFLLLAILIAIVVCVIGYLLL